MLVKIEAQILIFPGTDFYFPSTSVHPGTFLGSAYFIVVVVIGAGTMALVQWSAVGAESRLLRATIPARSRGSRRTVCWSQSASKRRIERTTEQRAAATDKGLVRLHYRLLVHELHFDPQFIQRISFFGGKGIPPNEKRTYNFPPNGCQIVYDMIRYEMLFERALKS